MGLLARSGAIAGTLLAVAASVCVGRAQETSARERWLVWVDDGDGATTFEIEATARGVRVVGRERGIVVGVDGERVRLVRSEVSALAVYCEDYGAPHPTEEVRGFQLDAVRASGTIVLLDPLGTPGLDWMTEYNDDLAVVATVGRYAVVHRDLEYMGECSSHLYFHDSYTWIDLTDAERLDIVPETPVDAAGVGLAADRMCAEIMPATFDAMFGGTRETDPDTYREMFGAACEPATAVRPFLLHPADPARPRSSGASVLYPTDVVPEWTGTGWVARHRLAFFIGDCCPGLYVLSGTSSALPPRLTGDDAAPALVARFLRRHPHATRLGFSRAP